MNKFTVTITKIDIRSCEATRRGNRLTSRCHVFEIDNPNAKPIAELFSGYRYNKPHKLWRKEVIPTVLQRMKLPTDTKVRWSQKAGCSCGCSPAFIIDSKCIPKDVFVNVTTSVKQGELNIKA